MIPFRVTFLGTGGTIPTQRRALAAFYVVRGGDKWLFDCGEGTQRQLWAATGGLPDLDGIFLTHFHADHTLGLPSIVSTMHLYGRKRPLSIYTPIGGREALQHHVALMPKKARSLLRWCETPRDALAAAMDDYEISTFSVTHAAGRAMGYVVKEYIRPGKIDSGMCAAAGLTGPEIGRVKAGETVKGIRPVDVLGPPQIGRKLVITGDTGPDFSVIREAGRADLLIHDATFLAGQNFDKDHSTSEDAGVAARRAQAKMLAPTHIGTRNNPKHTEEEAKRAVDGLLPVHVPRDLETYDLGTTEWL